MADSFSQMASGQNGEKKESESVKVAVRCRPMTEKELSDGHQQIVEIDTKEGVIELRPPRMTSNSNASANGLMSSMSGSIGPNAITREQETIKQFTFDAVFDWNAKQAEIYEEVVRPLVNSVLEGFNGTIFAYGQTGTGKTYTMEGIRDDEQRKGIIPQSFSHIFSHIARTSNRQYLVRASYLEIYQEEVRDLLCKDQMRRFELKERADIGVYVKDLSSFVCKSIKEIEHVMTIGNQNRSVGATNMNEHSSRSHAIFIITIEHSDINSSSSANATSVTSKLSAAHKQVSGKQELDKHRIGPKTTGDDVKQADSGMLDSDSISGEQLAASSEMVDLPLTSHIRVGKLNLVDLAGSERQAKTGTAGKRQKEAIKINLSLSALGNVISALVDGKSFHIPYRDSKLTRLLQDSLGGNSKTVMIANIGPASYNYEETLTTLRYANRAKNIKNKPRLNEDPKDALLRQFQLEIERLKYLLSQKRKCGLGSSISSMSGSTNLSLDAAAACRSSLMSASGGNDAAALDQEKLASKIKQMESKLLCGGKNIIDHTNAQQLKLEKRAQEIAEEKRKHRELQQRLLEQEENTLEIRETYTSLQQEAELKRRKLRKLIGKLQSVRAEVRDSQDANAKERRELEELQTELMKELKLKYLIIENFLPLPEKNRILSCIQFDDESEEWRLQPVSSSALNATLKTLDRQRFQVQFDRRQQCANLSKRILTSDLVNHNLTLLPLSLRYHANCNLILHLIEPEATTKTLEEPLFGSTMDNALDSALNIEPEITINARQATGSKWSNAKYIHPLSAIEQLEKYESMNAVSSSSSSSSSSLYKGKAISDRQGLNHRIENESMYPKARGLIKR